MGTFLRHSVVLATSGSSTYSQDVTPSSRALNETGYAPWRFAAMYTRCLSLFYPNVRVLLSQIRLSSVTFVRPTQGFESFGKSSSPFCTLAIFWPPCKILRRSSQGNPSVGGVKRKRASKIERRDGGPIEDCISCLCHVRVSYLLMNFLCFTLWLWPLDF